jgi:hypothetical protein
MLALFTKLHLAYPLTPIIVVQILMQRRRVGQSIVSRIREGLLPASWAAASAWAVFMACSLKVNWHAFFDFWFQYTGSSGDPQLALIATSPTCLRWPTARPILKNLADHFRPTVGLFTVSGRLFVVAWPGWSSSGNAFLIVRSRLMWPAALCVGLLPVVAFEVVALLRDSPGGRAIGFAYAVGHTTTHLTADSSCPARPDGAV